MPDPSYYDDLHLWVEEWYGVATQLRLDADAIHQCEGFRRDAHKVITKCEQHRTMQYQEAVFAPMPSFDQQGEDVTVEPPQVVTHSIQDMQVGLTGTLRDLRFTFPQRPPIRVNPREGERDQRHDDLADALSYYMNNVLSPVMRAAQPAGPEHWLSQAFRDAGANEQAAEGGSGFPFRGRLGDLFAEYRSAEEEERRENEDAQRYVGARGFAGFMDRLSRMGLPAIFGRRGAEEQALYGNPRSERARLVSAQLERQRNSEGLEMMRQREQRIRELCNRETAPTWVELRKLAEDDFHPIDIQSVMQTHDMEGTFEPTSQLRAENDGEAGPELEEELVDDQEDTDTMGSDTDECLGVGDAEAWFRERREEAT